MQDGSAGSSPLASALEAHPVPSLWVDAGGTPVWMNAAARALWSAAVDASGTTWPVALEPLGLPVHRLADPQAFSCDLKVPVDQGAGQQHRLAAAPATPQGRLVTLTPVQDLHQRAERADRLSEHLAATQEFGRLGVWERDISSLAARWDRHTFALWGMDPAAGMPVLSEIFQRVIAEDRDDFERALLDSLRHAGTYRHRLRVRHENGSLHHLHSQWMVLNGDDGLPQRAVGVIVDETEAWILARSHDATLTQLTAAVDVAQIALWRHDMQTRRLRLNAVAVALLGLDPSQQEYTDETLQSAVHPDDRELVRQSARQALQQAEPVDFECRIRHADGSWRTVHTRRVVERDALGQPRALLGVSLDLTRQRDDARRAGEWLRRLDLTASAAGIGYWSLERGARRATWSPRMYALHGLASDAEVPEFRTWLEHHVHPLDRERVAAGYRDWARSGTPTHEMWLRLLRGDGTVVHLHTHSHAEGTGEAALVFGIAIDVTARDAAEAALRHAAEQSALVARSVGLGTWTYDIVSGHVTWDEPMWQLRGLRPQAAPLSDEARLQLVHPDDRPRARRMAERVRHEAVPLDHEFRVRLPDGSWRWLASRSVAICDAEGTPVRRIGVNWDITDARNAVSEREQRLAAQREVQAKSQFLARMSHELRTPLNAVLGFTQLLLSESQAASPAVRAQRLEHIRSAGQHLLSLIDDVLDLSRLEGGEVAIALEPVPLRELAQGLLPLVEPAARERGVSMLAADLDFTPLADATRLRQVLLNLLTNAIKYNRAGGSVRIEATAADGVVALSVSDTGQGMSPQQMQHLFEPFNRLGAEGSSIEGTGIGLAIVKALVERMDGTVHVESVLGRGTRIELRLREGSDLAVDPSERASPQDMALAATAGRVGRGGTVLYIEDNPVNTLIVSELLAQRGDLDVHAAETGEGGVALARELRPHLILLDMQLPDIDGLEVFRRLRADPVTARIPCIALSANAMPDDIERALRMGFADYWTKPLDFRRFTASMEALFGPPPNPGLS